MSSADPRAITLSPGLVSTSSGEVERVLSALVPLDMPVHCAIPAGAGVALEGQIMDISEGGLGLLVRGAYLVPAPGTLIKGWQIERPGKDSVSVDLEVRHCRPLALADGASAQRWGCQFVDPSAEVKELMRLFASE